MGNILTLYVFWGATKFTMKTIIYSRLGFGNLAMFAGVCEMIARGMVGFVFVPMIGYTAACFAGPVAWIMADLFLIPAYFYVLKKLKTKYEQDYAGIVLEG